MENYIIIAILVVILGFGVNSAAKHFKGRGGCCGGGSYKPKKKRITSAVFKKTFFVSGMSCEHCKNTVMQIVNDIPGIAGNVNLKKGEVVVSYEKNVDDTVIKSKLESAGYSVTAVKEI